MAVFPNYLFIQNSLRQSRTTEWTTWNSLSVHCGHCGKDGDKPESFYPVTSGTTHGAFQLQSMFTIPSSAADGVTCLLALLFQN